MYLNFSEGTVVTLVHCCLCTRVLRIFFISNKSFSAYQKEIICGVGQTCHLALYYSY